MILLASSSHDFQHVLKRFAAESEVAGMKVSSFKSEATVLNQKKVECFLLVRDDSLPQEEVF